MRPAVQYRLVGGRSGGKLVALNRIGLLGLFFVVGPTYGNEALIEDLGKAREKVVEVEEVRREVMSSLYEINTRMKNMSKRRDILNSKLMNVEGNVKVLENSTRVLEAKINWQRQLLSKRLRAMYMLGDQTLVRTIFSANSSEDLDKSLKYLRLITLSDYRQIKEFENNLRSLERRKIILNREQNKLSRLRERLREQERRLELGQKSKSALLARLKRERENALNKLKGLREQALSMNLKELGDTTFFENKGRLPLPVARPLLRGYGLVENQEYRYRLAHKGYSFNTRPDDEVKSVFKGRVAYVGNIEGYGLTIIVDHFDHFYTVYSNNRAPLVEVGKTVQQGQVIARADKNFYFEIRHFSDAIDPGQWIESKEGLQ